ncbi:MAG: caspase family protein, partial [Pseudomonadota bacterium]
MLRLTLILAVLAPAPLSAERVRAVLVGVSDYAYIDADLEGPFNDVGLMAETLVTRGVAAEDITVLAEEGAVVPAGVMLGAPDRAPILAALNAAIEASTEGDTLIFYFSGHGAQAPDTNGDEGGGFDEIFLPRDTRNWSGGKGAVENAIIDDELSLITEAAAARGVALIGIIDACHSGTGFRAAPEENARARYIQPALLNIPEDTSMEPAAAAPAPPGDYVFLYAAQSDERAFEYPIGEERRWHGDFTLSLTTVMREIPDLTYEGLLEAAKSQMRRNGGKPAQTPDIEGPLANTAVIGGDAPGFERIDLERTTLKAGLTRGVTVGTELTLYADGADGPAGKARVTKVTALTSEIEYLEPFPTVRVSEAEITQRALDTSVRVGLGPGLAVDGLDGFL